MGEYPAEPPLDCDVIMKGGITSGVIYPLAVCELAKVYRLRSVGGASAGAIAAAAAAAAEFGRASGGFEALERVPAELTVASPAGGSTLFRLFQPDARTAGLFAVCTAGIGFSGFRRLAALLGALLRWFAVAALLGALPGLVVLAVGLAGTGVALVAATVAGVALLLAGALVGAGVGLLHQVGGVLPDHEYGLCSGMPGIRRLRRAEALTPWLHATLQRLAGRPDGTPLTFGDLRSRGCELRMMTTNLTRRQPLAMPWAGREYFFDPARWRALFPEDVVRWLEEHPPPVCAGAAGRWNTEVLRAQALPLRPLPLADELPVLVATRMSLSFPLLLSAVPLYAIDVTRVKETDKKLERCWFSDGGVSSNFPVRVDVLDTSSKSSAVTYGTNTTTILTISTNPIIKMIKVDCTWSFPRRGLFTNSVYTYRAPNQ